MVRLMLTLTPLVCVLAAISISHTLDSFMIDTNKQGTTNNIYIYVCVCITVFLNN